MLILYLMKQIIACLEGPSMRFATLYELQRLLKRILRSGTGGRMSVNGNE
jgi:hypothetical protein